MPSRDEVPAISRGSVCRHSHPVAWGETILGGGGGANYTAGTIRMEILFRSYSWSLNPLSPLFASGFILVLLIFPK